MSHSRTVVARVVGRSGWSLVAAALAIAAGCSGEPAGPPKLPPPKVTVERPVRESVTTYYENPARAEAVDSVDLLARVRGLVRKIHFADGQFVKQGDVLFEIEPEQYEAALEQAKAAIASAEADLKLKQVRLDKAQKAVDANAASPLELVEATANRDAAQATLEAAKAVANNAEIELGYTTVSAPFDGRISEPAVDVGDYVGASGGQTVLATVTALDPIYVYFNASERGVLEFKAAGKRIPRAENGQAIPEAERMAAKIQLADDSMYEHDGYIDYVDPKINPTTGTLPVRVRVPNPEFTLFPGQFARVLIENFAGEATLVPESAIGRDVVGAYLLVVGDDNVVARRSVKLGEQVDERRIILDGISTDDRIVTVGLQRARPGLPVDPQAPGAAAMPAKPAPPGAKPADTAAEPTEKPAAPSPAPATE